MQSRLSVILFAAFLVAAIAMVACGGGGGNNVSAGGTALVSTTLSDPPTCAAPSGPYAHVWVTISDVQIHTSSTANANDAGWVDLTPSLKGAPKQVDLLSLGGTGCVLAQLGSQTNIPAGTYQQIRVYLAPNNTNVASNACGNAGANCVVVNGTTSALQLSSETQTGIKIPSGQIAGGSFTVAAGQNKSLDIDFDACASIVVAGASYRLKPTMHAGEVSLQSNAITGQLVDSVSKAPLSNVKAIVALEQKDANGVDRVMLQVTPDSTGAFNICPVPAGTYDLVAVAIVTSGASSTTSYAATITTGVQPGNAVGNIPMTAQSGTGTATQQGIISGLISTAGSSAGTTDDVTITALMPITSGTSTVNYTIPLAQQQASSINVTTAAGACPSGTDCVQYQLGVPAAQPFIGAFAASGTTYTQVVGATVNYTVDAIAYITGSGGTAACSPNTEVQVSTTSTNLPLTVTAGQTTTAANGSLTGCQ